MHAVKSLIILLPKKIAAMYTVLKVLANKMALQHLLKTDMDSDGVTLTFSESPFYKVGATIEEHQAQADAR